VWRMYNIRHALDSVGLTEIEIIRTFVRYGEHTGALSWHRYGWCFMGGKDIVLQNWAPDSVACVLIDDNEWTVEACWQRGLDAFCCERWNRGRLMDLLAHWRIERMSKWAMWDPTTGPRKEPHHAHLVR